MKAVRGMFAALGDSPTYERDRANLVSGFTIGTAGLLLNGAVLCFVLPLLMDPDDPSFRHITESIGFGQTLALILLGGATIFATLLIPLRLVSVFWGPRIGRYFDQIVLSGISPMRFIIGKAMSQNLFLGLILFLLLPYLVLSITLGGVDWWFFLTGVFLVWLYCMALATVTLWVSLYINELMAAGLVIIGAAILLVLGSTPVPLFQPFCLTPMPVLLHPVYESMEIGRVARMGSFNVTFASCTVGISAVLGIALFGIYLGPLFGIIRDNSTFGEVVRAGDSKRKRRFRLRHHIQRPSELAFFYENRSPAFRGSDGILRWGLGFGTLAGLLLLVHAGSYGFFAFVMTMGGGRGVAEVIHGFNLAAHGVAMFLAIGLFAHAKNTMYQRTPFLFGWKCEVAKLDTWCFFLLAALSTGLALAVPMLMEALLFEPRGKTVFPLVSWSSYRPAINLARLQLEGTLILTLAGTVIYVGHRYLCQRTWLRFVAFFSASGAYLLFICMAPMFLMMMSMEMREFRDVEWLAEWGPKIAVVSPFVMFGKLFSELPRDFPEGVSTVPFYVVHGGLLLMGMLMTRRSGWSLRASYMVADKAEPASVKPTKPVVPAIAVEAEK